MTAEEFAALAGPFALVVDDEPLILMDTADMLSDEGFAVLEARSADEAFAFLTANSSVRLLFTDVQMPGEMDGFELARHASLHWPHVAVIVASGAVRPGEGTLPGNVRFLSKPVNPAAVRRTLEELGVDVRH